MRRTLLALASTFALGACGGDSRGAPEVGNTMDTTGAFPVFYARTPAAQWRAELESELGAEPDGGSAFGGVRSVALAPSGTIAVLDHRTPQILAFTADGTPNGSWGRAGAGPGEYRRPYSVAFLGDSLLLFDPGLSRITLFDHQRRWLREWTTPPNTGGGFVRLYQNPAGSAWVFATRIVSGGLERVFIRYPASGSLDTLPIPSYEPPADASARCNSPDGSISFYSAPFAGTLLSTPLHNAERVAAISTAYRLAFLTPAGDTARVIERPLAATVVTDSTWTAEVAKWTEFRQRIPTAQCSRESFARPATMPILHGMFSDDSSRLWVEAHGADGVRYDVFTPSGEFVASVSGLPASDGTVPSVLGNRIAVVVADSVGEQRVRVYRIRQP
jgi:hypothetical protein